jgi:hypothetical protein
VNALANEEVGNYLGKYFVASYQKVGTFRINERGKKQGGNVASYFCTTDGRVLHAVAGPVNAATLLKESRWVVETWKLAELQGLRTLPQYQTFFRNAHLSRLSREQKAKKQSVSVPLLYVVESDAPVGPEVFQQSRGVARGKQGKVHSLLAAYPLVTINRVYELVFRNILNEQISTSPVAKK